MRWASFSSRNLSTAIFLTLNNFWFFDRKYFYQTFRSYMQRILQAVPQTADYRSILPSSIHSLSMSTGNLIDHSTIIRSFVLRALVSKLSLLSNTYTLHHNLIHERSLSNQSFLLSNFVFAIQLMFTSTNCNIISFSK